MKHLLLTCALILNVFFVFSQEPKLIKKKENLQNGSAKFYVIKDKDSVKHGEYIVTAYSGNRKLVEGQYNYGKKTGIWIERYYGKEYKGMKSYGEYQNDSKVGKWIYFNSKGDTSQIYNYSKGELIYAKDCGTDTANYLTIINNIEIQQKLNCPPMCLSALVGVPHQQENM